MRCPNVCPVAAAYRTKPLIYMSASVIRAADWTPVARSDYGLRVASYLRGYAADRLRNPGAPPYSVSPWPFVAAWQYSSSGNVPGIGNRIDVNWFYGDAVTWAKYAGRSGTTHTVTPPASTANSDTPVGDVESLARAVIRGEYDNLPQRRILLGSRFDEVQARVNRILAGNGGGNATGGVDLNMVARRIIRGDFGNLPQRQPRVDAAYGAGTYVKAQTIVNGGTISAGNARGRVYVVNPGDCLSRVFPGNWQAVAQANGIANPNLIYPGQRIRY